MSYYENPDLHDFDANGERFVLQSLAPEQIRCIFDAGANLGDWARMAREIIPSAGIHRFEVRARDLADNFDLTPAVYEWDVDFTAENPELGPDAIAPDTRIASAPDNPTTSTSATFRFAGSDNLTPGLSLTFECQIDGGGFSAWTSPGDATTMRSTWTCSIVQAPSLLALPDDPCRLSPVPLLTSVPAESTFLLAWVTIANRPQRSLYPCALY